MGSRIEFSVQTPNNDLGSQVAQALARGLPEADSGGRALHLIANGPSARDYHFPRAETMALNGALKLFTDKGKAPSYWIACDPQALVADFLSEAPEETIYLVASKCHPSVFEKLKDRDVRVWHVSDCPGPYRQVPCAVSVTLCAMMLMHRLGYRAIETWGWDCCFLNGAHHAATGELGLTPEEITIEVDGGKSFLSTPTWACELKDAAGILPVLKWCGTDVMIHGDNLLGAVMHEYAAPALKAVA